MNQKGSNNDLRKHVHCHPAATVSLEFHLAYTRTVTVNEGQARSVLTCDVTSCISSDINESAWQSSVQVAVLVVFFSSYELRDLPFKIPKVGDS